MRLGLLDLTEKPHIYRRAKGSQRGIARSAGCALIMLFVFLYVTVINGIGYGSALICTANLQIPYGEPSQTGGREAGTSRLLARLLEALRRSFDGNPAVGSVVAWWLVVQACRSRDHFQVDMGFSHAIR